LEEIELSQLAHAAGFAAADEPGENAAQERPERMSLVGLILNSLNDDKAEEVIQIDLNGKSDMADQMIIASGRSTRQVISISEKLIERLKHGLGILARVEGKENGDWVLIDAGDAVVHVFRPEVREFYQLEKLWMPAVQESQAG